MAYIDGMASQLAVPRNLPGFATGGSFRVGGSSSIGDQQLVAFRANRGEMVDIRKPGNDNGGRGGDTFHISGNVLTPEMWAQIQMMDNVSSAQAVGTTARRASRRARRRMGK